MKNRQLAVPRGSTIMREAGQAHKHAPDHHSHTLPLGLLLLSLSDVGRFVDNHTRLQCSPLVFSESLPWSAFLSIAFLPLSFFPPRIPYAHPEV